MLQIFNDGWLGFEIQSNPLQRNYIAEGLVEEHHTSGTSQALNPRDLGSCTYLISVLQEDFKAHSSYLARCLGLRSRRTARSRRIIELVSADRTWRGQN